MALIAHWPLNGNTNDISGNGYNGTPTNITYVAGKIGQAGSFNGSSSRIVIGNQADFMFVQNFSISLWLYWNGNNSTVWKTILYKAPGNTTGYQFFINSSNQLAFGLGTTTSWVRPAVSATFPINTWTHVTIQYDGSYMSIYQNGSRILHYAHTGLILANTNDLKIGSNNSNTEVFPGLINDVRVFNHALTDMEIQEITRAQILHYSFDDFQEPTTNYGRMLETVSLSTGLSSSWSIEKLDRDTVKVTALINNPSFSDFGNITNTLTGTRTIIAGNPVTVSCEIVDFKGSLNRIFPASGGFGTLIGNESSFTQGPAGTYLGRVFRTITHTSNWTHNIQIRVSGAANILAGDYLTIRLTQIEEKAYPTEYVHTSRTGRVNDYSGFFNNSMDLIETTTPRWSSDSKIGNGAYRFDTSLRQIKTVPSKNFQVQDFTISAWAKLTNTGTWQVIMMYPQQNDSHVTPFFDWAMYVGTNGELHIRINGEDDNRPIVASSVYSGWTHLAITRTNSIRTNKYYVNGQLVNTRVTTVQDIVYDFDNSVFIGSNPSGSERINGSIDDLRFYATPLSDKDILDIYNTKAEIEQSGVLYARDFLSDAEATVNIATDSFLESGWTGSSELIDSATKTFRLSQPFPSNSSAWRTYYYNVSNYIGQTITISAFFRVLSETNGNFLDVTVGQGNTGSFPLHIKGSNEIDKFTSINRNYHFISWTGVINSTGIVGFTVWIHNLVSGALIISELSKVQVEVKPYATPFISTFRPAIELPTEVQFGADEIHETGIANFEDFSTVGITDGLIGYWPLNGSAIDYSGNNYNGTVSGALAVSGLNDRAYSFDGVDDYISTDLSIKNVDKTISFFIKKDGAPTAGAVVNQWYSPASWLVYIVQTSGFVRYYSYNGSAADFVDSTVTVCDNSWHHVAMTYTSSNNLLSIYIDGTFNISKNLTVEEATTSSNGLWMGRENGSTVYNPFQGTLDEMKIFNRPLTAEEVQIEYNTMFNNQVQVHEDGVVYAKDIVQY